MPNIADQFNLSLEAFAKHEAPEIIELAIQRLAADALVRLVEKTPVDTGRARGAWTVGLGAAASPRVGISDKRGQRTIGVGLTQIGRTKLGQDVFISNNVAYIQFLESGSSKQAPEGMLTTTIAELAGTFS